MAADTTTVAVAAARALVPDLPPDTIAIPDWTRKGTTLLVSLDQAEHARRTATPTGPLPYDNPGLLDLLMSLPCGDCGEPVPLNAFTARDRKRLRAAEDAGAVTISLDPDGFEPLVVRNALRPLRVDLAVVTGGPRTALGWASGFAPFNTRAVLLRKHPGEDYLFEADFYGIGVAIPGPAGPIRLLAPDPWRAVRHSVAGWHNAETIYKHLLTHPDLIPDPTGTTGATA